MRYYAIGFTLVNFLGFAFCACSTGTTTTTTTTTSGSGADAAFDCHDVRLFEDPCDACLADKCCSDLWACGSSDKCIYCTTMDEHAEICRTEPHRSVATAIHECGWGQCREACAHYSRSLGPDPNDPVDKFCSTVGLAFCKSLFSCCGFKNILDHFGGTLDGCNAMMTGSNCIENSTGLDGDYTLQRSSQSFYGLRRRLKDGQTILDQTQLDACVAGLTSMTVSGAACVADVRHFFGVQCMTAFKGQIALGDACEWYPSSEPGLTYAFIPCKEGRCEEGKCTAFRKVGDTCDTSDPFNGPGACDYLHNEACYVNVAPDTWACGPQKEIGDACSPLGPRAECKSESCDANHTCALATSMSLCNNWY